jgi:hypothetical protein
MNPPCATPFGRAPSLTREQCLEQVWAIRAGDHSKRVVCHTKERVDVIDSAGEIRAEWEEVQ